jgi:hydroxyacylglutathione hydrolase
MGFSPGMEIDTVVVGPFQVNCYLVWSQADKVGVIIDPGDEDELILSRISRHGFRPEAILLTHGHADHIAAVETIKNKYNIPLYAGIGEEELLSSPESNISALFGFHVTCPPADRLLADSEVLSFGSLKFTVFSTPGHSPGGVCYFAGNYLFCGDTLFAGSIGRTDLRGGNLDQLIRSIERNILTLPDEIVCYPGHGPATTVGQERRTNPFLSSGRFA